MVNGCLRTACSSELIVCLITWMDVFPIQHFDKKFICRNFFKIFHKRHIFTAVIKQMKGGNAVQNFLLPTQGMWLAAPKARYQVPGTYERWILIGFLPSVNSMVVQCGLSSSMNGLIWFDHHLAYLEAVPWCFPFPLNKTALSTSRPPHHPLL